MLAWRWARSSSSAGSHLRTAHCAAAVERLGVGWEVVIVVKLPMKRSAMPTRKGSQRRRARRDVVTAVGLPSRLWRQIDRWQRDHGAKTRSEALRRLLEQTLGSDSERQISAKFAAKASDLAGNAIDRLADPSATRRERANRKRRLLKGPPEFRTARRKARI